MSLDFAQTVPGTVRVSSEQHDHCLKIAIRALINCGGCYIGVLVSFSCSGGIAGQPWIEPLTRLLRVEGWRNCWLEMGKNTFLRLLDVGMCTIWPGLFWGVCAVRDNSLGKSVGGLVMVGHRSFVTCVSLRRRMWVTCRWVKPECKIKPFGDPPGPGGALCVAGLSAVFTLGWWRLPHEGRPAVPRKFVGPGDICGGFDPLDLVGLWADLSRGGAYPKGRKRLVTKNAPPRKDPSGPR